MRSVHALGLGMLVGAIALGGMLSVMTYRWQAEAFPESGPKTATTAPQGGTAAAASAQDVARGKTAFESQCAGCHTIGGGKKTGPDLKGVAGSRPHDWLIGFITAPDQLIAGGDATATRLVKEYGMPMPNLGISKSDAEAILAYISSR